MSSSLFHLAILAVGAVAIVIDDVAKVINSTIDLPPDYTEFPAGEEVPRGFTYYVKYSNVSISFKPRSEKQSLEQDRNLTLGEVLFADARRQILGNFSEPWQPVDEFEISSRSPWSRGTLLDLQLYIVGEKESHDADTELTWTTLLYAVVGVHKCFEAYPYKSLRNGFEFKIFISGEEKEFDPKQVGDGVLLKQMVFNRHDLAPISRRRS